jgi:hypothetical protein
MQSHKKGRPLSVAITDGRIATARALARAKPFGGGAKILRDILDQGTSQS